MATLESLRGGGRDSGADPHRPAPLTVLVFGVALALLAVALKIVLSSSYAGFDFHYAYWGAGQRLLNGQSPYLWTPEDFRAGYAFVYPALSAVMFAPLSLLGRDFGAGLFTCVSIALVPGTLWLLRVRDWRVYASALIWLPVGAAWVTANETMFLVFGTALLWRFRDRERLAGAAVAVMISLKPLMWPLAVWLLATRRWRASGFMFAVGCGLNIAAWSIVGWGEAGAFLHAASLDTTDVWRTGYGVAAALAHLGLRRQLGVAAMVVLSLPIAAGVVYEGCVRRDELRSLTWALALIIVASPLVWNHYLAYLLVPMALCRPRMTWLWLLPVPLWLDAGNSSLHGWQVALVWVVAGSMFAAVLRRTRLPTAASRELAGAPREVAAAS